MKHRTEIPFVSVVIPVRNRERHIGPCIESILRQTQPPAEIVVVDDASIDDTAGTVEAFRSPLIRLVTLPSPVGAQAARNTGVREASGDWIAFLDSDDDWLPTKLEKQIEELEKVGTDPWTVVYTNGTFVDDGRPTGRAVIVDPIEGSQPFRDLLRRSGPLFQSMLVSREALEKIGYLDESVPAFQEWDTSLQLSRHCRFIYVDEELFLYHRHSGHRVSKDRALAARGYRYITSKYENDIRSLWGEEAWQDDLLQRVLMSLDAGLWAEADEDLGLITRKNPRVTIFRLCRLLHLSPAFLVRLKKSLAPTRLATRNPMV